jgi:hypothetical protein
MMQRSLFRRLALAVLGGFALVVAAVSAPIVVGGLTPAAAQVSGEFQAALAPYGTWRRHPRFGEVWVPAGVPPDWRPYEYGHWVYTDEWGWYWVSDENEEDWGWVAFHYGRWAFERGFGWFWIPGDEWAPAWVDWRYGADYIGWSPLPPDELIDANDVEPSLWIFVAPRYMTAPRLRGYIVPPQRRAAALRSTRIVNRTLAVQGARLAVNPGISPGFIAAVTHKPLPAYQVRPRVLAGTQGVAGAVVTKPGPRGAPHANAVAVTPTATVIRPAASPAAPPALRKDERGRLGATPPRAAQTAPAGAPKPPAGAPPPGPKAPSVAPPPGPPPVAHPPAAGPPPVPHPGEPPPQPRPPQPRPLHPEPPQTPPPPPPHPVAPAPHPVAPPPHPVAPPPHPVAPPHPPAPPPAAHPVPPVARPAPPPQKPPEKKEEEKK